MPAPSPVRDRVTDVLGKPCYGSIQLLFGQIVAKRLMAPDYNCTLLRLLHEDNMPILEMWNGHCKAYLDALKDRADASAKVARELVGSAQESDPEEFDRRLGDFLAEVCVVGELASKRAFTDFKPLVPPAQKNGITAKCPDYSCLMPIAEMDEDHSLAERTACLEVKNLNAPIGLTEIFSRMYFTLIRTYPELSHFRIVLKHWRDDSATDEQRQAVCDFMTALALKPKAQTITIMLPEKIEVHIQVIDVDGIGGMCVIRPIDRAHSRDTFTNPEKLSDKARSIIKKGIEQLSNYDFALTRILALNIMTPNAMLRSDDCINLQNIVHEESSDTVACLLFHHHGLIE